MNTKFFFLLLVSFFISTSTSSLVATKIDTEIHIENQATSQKETQAENPIDVQSKWAPAEHAKPHGEKAPLQPEDGKHHHFHFLRVESRKRRRACQLFVCKAILTIAHLCCFIYCFLHVFH